MKLDWQIHAAALEEGDFRILLQIPVSRITLDLKHLYIRKSHQPEQTCVLGYWCNIIRPTLYIRTNA